MKRVVTIFCLCLSVAGWMSCHYRAPKHESIKPDTTITRETSFNNLFLDSAEIAAFLQSDSDMDDFADKYFMFYKQRNYEFAWFDSTGLIEQAGNLISLIDNRIAQTGDSSLYNPQLYVMYNKYRHGFGKGITQNEAARAELFFTGTFFKYASKVYSGAGLNAEELGWFIPRKKLDLTVLLDSSLHNNDAGAYFARLLNPRYRQLDEYLLKYIKLKQTYPQWPAITLHAAKWKLDDKSNDIRRIRRRLALLGDIPEDDSSHYFDEELQEGVKSFQKRMGLSADGVIGPGFMRRLNIPLDTLIRTILINRERARWLPASIPATYVWVNIPSYHLWVYEEGNPVLDMNVIVGSAAHGTVIFSGNLKYIVFAPYWNVPSSIVQKEVWPGIKANPNYLANHKMEITGYRKSGEPIVRQLPGENNALGRVKFLFPNDYNIYLHDTPNRDLFSSSDRSLSHGCIRIADPPAMAAFLLRNQPAYTEEKIDSLMNINNVETWVSIKPTVPVYLVYFTAFVDDEGRLNFRRDIYGHDKKMADKLFSK